MARSSTSAAGRFVRWVEPLDLPDGGGYPFGLPVVEGLRAAGRLELAPGVTFLVGDNGSGKSTLVEAIAVAAGFNPEGCCRRTAARRSTHARMASRSSICCITASARAACI